MSPPSLLRLTNHQRFFIQGGIGVLVTGEWPRRGDWWAVGGPEHPGGSGGFSMSADHQDSQPRWWVFTSILHSIFSGRKKYESSYWVLIVIPSLLKKVPLRGALTSHQSQPSASLLKKKSSSGGHSPLTSFIHHSPLSPPWSLTNHQALKWSGRGESLYPAPPPLPRKSELR